MTKRQLSYFSSETWSRFAVMPVEGSHFTKTQNREASEILSPSDSLSFEKWLPFAAAAYNISPNPEDYFFRPVISIVSDLPNRNGAGFPLAELVKWNGQQGRQGFKTWVGKPMLEEHGKYHPDPDNPDEKLALGVIADVELMPLRGFGDDKLWKVLKLAAIDRTSGYKLRNKNLPALVEEGKVNTYSMGALVGRYTCSACGSMLGKCTHIDPNDPTALNDIDGVLAYKLCHDIEGVELSVVMDPAVGLAASDVVRIKY